ncbi:unnamed protein product, partial [Heterotrigona itama]
EEDDKFVAPPTSPVESFKYAPLTKFRKYCPFIPPLDADYNNPSPLHDNSNVVVSSPVESRVCTRNPISRKEVATLDIHDSSTTGHREKEKLEFTGGCCATKFYSNGSTICYQGSIVDVNEGKGLKEGFSLSNVVDKESKRRFVLQPDLRTISRLPCEENSSSMLTEVDRIELASRNSDSLDEKRPVEPKLWKQLALLANRSSDNFSSGDSTLENCNREGYTFLEKMNVPWYYKRVVRLRSTANLLDFSNRWIKSSQFTSHVHQSLDSSRITDKGSS